MPRLKCWRHVAAQPDKNCFMPQGMTASSLEVVFFSLTVFTIDDDHKIMAEETVSSPAGCGCKSNIAQTLSEMGVKMMLAGNMGQGAVNVLDGYGIEVLRGCKGDVRKVAEQWLSGRLKDSGIACELHEHGCHQA
jgi:predicted Fe-Mo cluster-binding NifX family protein